MTKTILRLCVAISYAAVVSSGVIAPIASSYVYRNDNNGPGTYLHLTPGAVNPHLVSYPLQAYQQRSPFAASLPIIQAPAYHQPIVQLASTDIKGPVVGPAQFENIEEEDENAAEDSEADNESGSDESDEQNEESLETENKQPIVTYGNSGSAHENGGGNSYGAKSYSGHGGKGEKGYESSHGYEKGASGSRGSEGHKGFYNEGKGDKGSHFDEADNYGKHEESAKGYKGGDFGEKKSHSKGAKTTGFHNVYHKDEYKKNHQFYDESDNQGHFRKYGGGDAQHGSAAGGYKKSGHNDSGHAQKEFGKKGFKDSGHHDQNDSGYSKKSGDDSYYTNFNDYASKQGNDNSKAHGFARHY